MNKRLTKNEWIAVVVSLIAVGFMLFISLRTAPLFSTIEENSVRNFIPESTSEEKVLFSEAEKSLESPDALKNFAQAEKLGIIDAEEGTGEEAKSGDTVVVHYTGFLTDGTKFDSSIPSGQPVEFVLGQGMLISGWEEGIPGMKEGGLRILVVPPHLGYGAEEVGPIHPNSVLIFLVNLVDIKN